MLQGGRIDGARGMPAETLRGRVAEMYETVLGLVTRQGRPHVLRVWNVVPGITEALGEGDRYMAFNAGRHDAYVKAMPDFPANLPAASGVGRTAGDELDIVVLSSTLPGTAVENRRQVSAYRYSQRYGKLPPCFSRAMRWGETVFVSGTAAILGEDTKLEGDLAGQMAVTVENLREVAGGARFRELRAYVPGEGDRAWVCGELVRAFPEARVEAVRAELCRKNLLVEVEGLAAMRG